MSKTNDNKNATDGACKVRQIVRLDALAAKISEKIFACGDEPGSPCTRIQFKGGKWPDNERNQGGIEQVPLYRMILEILNEHLKPNNGAQILPSLRGNNSAATGSLSDSGKGK